MKSRVEGGQCYLMNGVNSTRQWLVNEGHGCNKAINELVNTKIVKHLIWITFGGKWI
jgi:hypothetical protein